MPSILLQILLFVGGFILIFIAADGFLDNMKVISDKRMISPYIMGAILLGVDVEETIASVTAAVLGYSTVAVGNAIGNNTISMTIPLAIPALIFSYKVKAPPRQFTFAVIAILAVHVLAITTNSLFPPSFFMAGMFTITIYACLLAYNVTVVKKMLGIPPDDKQDHELLDLVKMEDERKGGHRGNRDGVHVEPEPLETIGKKRVAVVCISLVMLIAGGYFLSEGLDGIVGGIGVAQSITGYVIVALGVNAEEFLLIYKSVKKKIPEVGIGGIIMKTAWNLGITYGLSVLIAPAVPLAPSLFVNIALIAVAFAFLAWILRTGTLSKKGGIAFMAIFTSYMIVNMLLVTS